MSRRSVDGLEEEETPPKNVPAPMKKNDSGSKSTTLKIVDRAVLHLNIFSSLK